MTMSPRLQKRSSGSTSKDAYCPFNISRDAAAFGLVKSTHDSRFGKLLFVHRPERTSETATLFVHGVGAGWSNWTPMLLAAQELGESPENPVLVDLPGFGESENLCHHLMSEKVVTELVAIVHSLGYGKIRVVGHSMGGFIAMDTAVNYPQIVTSVHLAAGAYFSVLDTVKTPFSFIFKNPTTTTVYWTQYLLAQLRVGRVLFPALNKAHLLRPLLSSLVAHPRLLKSSVVDAIAEEVRPRSFVLAAKNGTHYNARAKWADLAMPVTAVFGSQDRLVPPEDMRTLKNVLPSCTVTSVHDSSHFLHIERPFETWKALALRV